MSMILYTDENGLMHELPLVHNIPDKCDDNDIITELCSDDVDEIIDQEVLVINNTDNEKIKELVTSWNLSNGEYVIKAIFGK